MLTTNSLQTQAKTYEQNLRSAIHKYTVQQDDTSVFDDIANDPMEVDYTFETFGRSKEQLATNLQESLMAMNRNLPPLDSPTEEDALTAMVMHLTRETTTSITDSHLTAFAPPLSITPLLSFSHILSAQSRLINRACLRMFFKEHNIRPHLQLLRRFQLFGDGVFASRLTHALFDADMDSTERRTGSFRTGGTMGLKLGSRETWPPASSELRLALMNVLTESFSQPTGLHSVGKTGELPGGLSFAVREMSQEELDRCMDPNGISALDFLKLEYRPPAPLEVIITRAAMLRYDTIFRLLLRMLRMLFVVNQLWREEGKRKVSGVRRRFGMEARHFVGALAGYMVESGIGTTWDRFERKLAEVEAQVDREGECSGEEISLDRVRAWHEGVLDRIMFAMLSRKRQLPVMKIVEEIFEVVLKFSVVCGRGEGGEAEAEEVAKLYKMFRRRVGVFISVCRGLSEKRGYGDSGEKRADAALGEGFKEEANLLGMLLLGLEMSGYYSGGAGAGTATTVGSKRRR